MKQCYICGHTKPLSEFHRNRHAPDGLCYECKECRKARTRRRSASLTPEQRAERAAQERLRYASLTPEQRAEWLARKRLWYASLPPERRAEQAASSRRSAATPAGKNARRVRKARRRARKALATVEGSEAAVTAFYKWASSAPRVRCYLCGQWVPRAERHVDHIMPLARGGKHEAENLTILCARCNQSKCAKLPREVGLLF